MDQKIGDTSNVADKVEQPGGAAKPSSPTRRRLPVGWIILGLVLLSWVAIYLIGNGAFFLFHVAWVGVPLVSPIRRRDADEALLAGGAEYWR